MKQLEKVYDPKQVEERIYKQWEDGGYFTGVRDEKKKPFTIVIPPPNVTGQLHLGHAFDNTLQDILIRYKRMQGYAALWVPGTDHAGIATQIRVEQDLRENEGITRYDLGREKFVERVWEWKHMYGNRIVEQLRKLGSSCDWSRERFTMDEGCSRAVQEVFINLYEKGLIYKGLRIINWCPDCRTALSDTEVEHEEHSGHLWHIKYPIKDSSEFIIVATTRPETMLGDTGVAVHPDDKRYKHLIGAVALLPLTGREIPIVADDFVDSAFGTGCVKVTPCHDPNDFEIGQRHNLEQVLMLDGDAKVINSGKYNTLDRYAARKQVLADLEALGLLEKTEEHTNNIGMCHRCGTIVEPIASEQWFVKMQPLAREAIRVVEDGTIKFVPERFAKVYIHWMENVRDWCISRQLWWGHRIPAWYCGCGHVTVSRIDNPKCGKCGKDNLKQDEDVLDTWFSSALWPFSTLGWPDKTEDLEYFYPTDVLVTGYEIIFFWVARMIFSGMEHMKREPFHTVFIHGMIRDDKGQKMSKSLGNGIDPLDIIDKYGADALRFYIVTGNAPGADMRYFPERCEAMRNFANKIWNAGRFVMMNIISLRESLGECGGFLADFSPFPASDFSLDSLPADRLRLEDKWIISKLNTLTREVCQNLDKFELGLAAGKLYDFIWDDFCDWYIELAKPRLSNLQITSTDTLSSDGADGGAGGSEDAILQILCNVLTDFLTLLHPFMPFLTEEIYSALTESKSPLMIRPYPVFDESKCFAKEEADFESIKDVITAIRTRRAEMNVPPSQKSALFIVTGIPELFEKGTAYIGRLAYASEVILTCEPPGDSSDYVTIATKDARLYMPLSDLVDMEKERERILREIEKTKAVIAQTKQKLSNEQFVSKAKESVVQAERDKLAKAEALLSNLEAGL